MSPMKASSFHVNCFWIIVKTLKNIYLNRPKLGQKFRQPHKTGCFSLPRPYFLYSTHPLPCSSGIQAVALSGFWGWVVLPEIPLCFLEQCYMNQNTVYGFLFPFGPIIGYSFRPWNPGSVCESLWKRKRSLWDLSLSTRWPIWIQIPFLKCHFHICVHSCSVAQSCLTLWSHGL